MAEKNTSKLTLEERVAFLEEQSEYLIELLESNNKAYMELIKSLNILMKASDRQTTELKEWSQSVETRLGKMIIEQLNHSLIIGETISLTVEQRKNIQKKYDELTKQVKELEKDSNEVVSEVSTENKDSQKDKILNTWKKVEENKEKTAIDNKIPSENAKPLINKNSLRSQKSR